MNLGCFPCHCFGIYHAPFFYDFVYMVYLPFSQTHGLSVLYVIYFTTCLVPLSQQDHNSESSFVIGWIYVFIVSLLIRRGIRAFRCEMIIFPTSVTPNLIMISTYPRFRSGVRLLSSPWDRPTIISVSTSSSSMVFISVSTLTSVPKCPLGILSVICSCITSCIIILMVITSIT